MKHGKYNLEEHSNRLSVGSSRSWMYQQKPDFQAVTEVQCNMTLKNKTLERTSSDSTLFSDYANQVKLFEYEKKRDGKLKTKLKNIASFACVKTKTESLLGDSVSAQSDFKSKYKYTNDNVLYRTPLNCNKSLNERKIMNGSVASSDIFLTLKPPVIKRCVKDQMYSSKLSQKSYGSRYSSLPNLKKYCRNESSQSSHCYSSEKNKHLISKTSDYYSSLLRDYSRNMNKWNETVDNFYTTLPNLKSSVHRKPSKNTQEYVKSLHSTMSNRKAWLKSNKYNFEDHSRSSCSMNTKSICDETYSKTVPNKKSKIKALSDLYSNTLTNIKNHPNKSKEKHDIGNDGVFENLEAFNADYDRRLKEWTDALGDALSDDSVCVYLLLVRRPMGQ